MTTYIGVNDAQAVKKWATTMAVQIGKESWFASKMVGVGVESRKPIQQIDDLESGAGDEITIDLLMPMSMEPRIGDQTLDGHEQDMRYYTDDLRIDQVRGGVNAGGRMTQKRTLRNLRTEAKRLMKDWWKRLLDELYFIYLTGTVGNGLSTRLVPSTNAIYDINGLEAADTMHQLYGGTATSLASITSSDGMSLRLVDKAVARAETMGADGSDELSMVKCYIDGMSENDGFYTMVMHTWQFDAMKSTTSTGQWLDIQKAAAAAQGQANPIFKGNVGDYNGVVMHKHRNVIRRSDAGAGANLPAAHALFLGAQAGLVAYGDNGGGARYKWTEEVKDHGNQVAIGSYAIMGMKKATYQSKDGTITRDFGVMNLLTYCVDPNA
jgi:N4-gp56 family major capsid protein